MREEKGGPLLEAVEIINRQAALGKGGCEGQTRCPRDRSSQARKGQVESNVQRFNRKLSRHRRGFLIFPLWGDPKLSCIGLPFPVSEFEAHHLVLNGHRSLGGVPCRLGRGGGGVRLEADFHPAACDADGDVPSLRTKNAQHLPSFRRLYRE